MLSQIDRGRFVQPQQKEFAVLNLPVDVITRMICSFLTVRETGRARAVSKQFRMLMDHAIECYTDIFESSNIDMQSAFARALVRRMRNARHIRLYNTSQSIIQDLAIRVGAKLRVLECINCSMSDLALANIARGCLGLEVIRVTMRSNGEISRISDVSLAFIARKAACADFLREVSIQGCPKVTDLGLAYLLFHCRRLKVLKASECGVSNALQLPASMLSLNSHEQNVAVKLDVLDLSSNHELTPGALLSIPHIGSLRSLRISGAVRITDAALQQIAQECFNLEELSIANCSQITDQGLEAFAFSGAAMRLEHLDVARCSRIADTGLNAIVKFGNLRTLDAQGCFRVSDYFLRTAGMYGRNLESVNLKGLASLTDAGVDALAKGCPKLKDLCLGSCHALGDETLLSLSANCPKLEKLDLFCVHHVTDDGMKSLVKGCPNITSINLSYCFHVTGDFIKGCKDKKNWKGLKELAITGLQDSVHVGSSISNQNYNNKSKLDEFEGRGDKRLFNTSPKLGSSSALLNTSPKLGSLGFAVDLSVIDSPERKRDNNNRRRSGSLQRQDSNSSLVSKKTPVPGVQLDVAGSPRAKLQALSNREQMSVLSLSDGVSSPPASLPASRWNGTRQFGDSPKDLEREKAFQVVEEELEREKKNRKRE